MQTLDEIALKHGTDKSSAFHNYCGVYERYFEPFRQKQINILEFGVDTGASIRTWLEYFPHASVVGCDRLDCPPIPDPRYSFKKGEILDSLLWSTLGVFDIIIDDNGHSPHESIGAIQMGFDHVAPGGIFILEDLHTCYNRTFTPLGARTPLDEARSMVDVLNDYGNGECGDIRKDKCRFHFIHFWKSLLIIGKRYA